MLQASRAATVKRAKAPNDPRFTIRDLAEEFGCTHRTIRFYEDEGLL